jgi:two-component system, OmpR family, sensor histidine kinase RstB
VTRLYVRLYLALLASLAVFALAAALLWHSLADGPPPRRGAEIAARLAQNALPPASAPAAEQQAALERLSAGLHSDAALLAADGKRLAAVGSVLEGGRGVWRVRLADGRLLIARGDPGHRRGGMVALALILVAVGAGAYPVVRRLTRRIERLQSAVDSLGAGDLSARVRVEGKDEVARLAGSFNHAAARIEALVGAHKSLLANASHELRTPLARIRMAVELMKADADEKRKAELTRDIAELDALIEEILMASRLDGAPALALEDLDLLGLVAEECARYDAVAFEGEPRSVRGDARLLRRMVRNLLENAVRHGAPPVQVSLRATPSGATLRVRDAGPQIRQEDHEKIFQPFWRGRGAGAGAGLGLSIVRQIARMHGGEVSYDGSFVVVLP